MLAQVRDELLGMDVLGGVDHALSAAGVLGVMIRRVRCWFLGCAVHRDYPACGHCSADLYGGAFLDAGKLAPLVNFAWRLRKAIKRWGPKRCEQCGKKFVRGYDEYLCSEECFDEWLPF